MSYDFWVDINAAGDLGSGCTQDLSPAWSGTVDISGTSVTKVSGPSFPEALLDGNHFIRVDPEGLSDSTVRILSGGAGTLVLTEDMGTMGEVSANIGGAFKNPADAISAYIPYANGVSIAQDINILIKPGTYSIEQIIMLSATQDANYYRRRILGYGGGFVDGVFSGPILTGYATGTGGLIKVGCHGIVLAGLKIINEASGTNIRLDSGKYNLIMRDVDVTGGNNGFAALDGSCSNLIGCRFDDAAVGINGFNTTALRCVVDGCDTAFQGRLSSYVCCAEFNTLTNIVNTATYPSAMDFSYCRFFSNKTIKAEKASQAVFSHCIFDHDLNPNTDAPTGDLTFENCVVGGAYTPQEIELYQSIMDMCCVRANAGTDNFGYVFEPALNFETNYPDPVLDKYCRFTTAGPHEYRFPVEAVGARALRNRQRVSLTEIGL